VPLSVRTLAERPDLAPRMDNISASVWPEFMQHDEVANRHWGRLLAEFSGFQVVVCEGEGVVAAGNTIPVVWEGTAEALPEGWDAAFEGDVRDHEAGREPTAVSALSVTVAPEHQGKGLSVAVLRAMRALARERGHGALIAPVRPSLENLYPLTPIERYARRTGEDGPPFDPWLRVHRRLGAEVLRLAPRSMEISGTVAEWEGWGECASPRAAGTSCPGPWSPSRWTASATSGSTSNPTSGCATK
jgi:GNAT superfamily N-acetyltransferase